jgi:PAS domain S-box-containing protein
LESHVDEQRSRGGDRRGDVGALRVASSSELAGVSEELLRWAFDRSPNGMSVVALDGRWLRINDAYCRLLGYEAEELVGASVGDFTHPDDLAAAREFVAAAVTGERVSAERDKRYVAKDGSVVWARVRAEVIHDEEGEPLCFVSHLQDIGERRAARDLVRDSERTLRSVIDNTPAVICVKGRDHRYKLVNREFEQMFGVDSDWIVGRSDAEVLSAATVDEIRGKDQLVLDGGQVPQEEMTTVRDGRERVFLTTRFPLLDEDGEIHAVCIASTDITERRLEERIKRERLECSELIYAALAQERFVLHGQPIVNLDSMQPTRVELLIRMKVRGSGDLMAPGGFLPAAERFALISVIDEWVIDRAIALAAADHRITVNVSAMTISDPRQVDRIAHAVITAQAPPENLVFEITETAVADNLDAARTFGTRMHELGCAVALDDFGVGHGTFTYLKHLRVDYLKIDMQFVRNLLDDDEDRQVVQAIIGVARQFKIETIAEGVEDQATLEQLRRMGVDYAQGYWIGRPVPLAPPLAIPMKRRQGDTHGRPIQ